MFVVTNSTAGQALGKAFNGLFHRIQSHDEVAGRLLSTVILEQVYDCDR